MYKENNKKKEIDNLWAMFGNQNINNSTKSAALDDKYWEGHK